MLWWWGSDSVTPAVRSFCQYDCLLGLNLMTTNTVLTCHHRVIWFKIASLLKIKTLQIKKIKRMRTFLTNKIIVRLVSLWYAGFYEGCDHICSRNVFCFESPFCYKNVFTDFVLWTAVKESYCMKYYLWYAIVQRRKTE